MDAAPTAACASEAHAAIVAALGVHTRHRRHTTPICRWLMNDPEAREIGRAIANCSLRLRIEARESPDHPPDPRLTAAFPCNRRLCPWCEWRRSRVQRARLLQGVGQLLEAEPTLKPLLLTLTQRNVPVEHLGGELGRIHAAWNRLTKRDTFPAVHWYRRTEITVSTPESRAKARASDRGDSYNGRIADNGEITLHPHLHCLLFVRASYFGRDYIKQADWAENWRQCLGIDYPPVVDVRRAYAKPSQGHESHVYLGAAMEVSKYLTKQADLPSLGPLVGEFNQAVKGVRLRAVSRPLSRYISAAEVKASELLDSPLPDDAGGSPIVRLVADWCDRLSAYQITPSGGGA